MSGPFGVDLTNATFKNTSDSEQSSGEGHSAASSTDAAPSGEAFKDAASAPKGDSDRQEVVQSRESKEYSKEELEKLLGIESQSQSQPQQSFQKFDDNFGHDLATLMKDPGQFQKFAGIYPPQYVERARQVLMANGINPYSPQQQQQQQTQQPNDPFRDPRMQEVLQMAEMYKQQQKEQRIESINNKLDTSFEKLGTKYPDADKNVVNWYLQGLANKGISLMDDKGNLRTQVIEKLFKADHDNRNKSYEAKYRAKVDAQKKMNLKSKDMGSGGSLGTAKSSEVRTIKDATKAMLNDIRQTR
jgi:hypothetical protein